MSLDDSFRERQVLSAEQTYSLCKIKKQAEVYDLVGFGDPMTRWSERAEKLGSKIVPRQVYLAKIHDQYDHRVAWVYHSEVHEDHVEDYHHLACDCLEHVEDPTEIEEIASCPAVLAALEHRAARINQVLKTQGVFDFYGKRRGEVAPRQHALINTKSMVNFLMNYEQKHPEGWVANTVSGEHQVSLLATVFQIRPYPDSELPNRLSMLEVIQDMHNDGSLTLHENESVTLRQTA